MSPLVALESTLIAHGLPWPVNLETARQAEADIRELGATPATIAVWYGEPVIGLSDSQLEELARSSNVFKASRRDLGAAVALRRLAATTVSATMALAHGGGIRVFATGGVGGVHRGDRFDISADLAELARTPVLVVCAGAKCILDLPRTMELLETLGVPVIGYRTDEFPAFTVCSSGLPLPVSVRVETAAEAAAVFDAHVHTGGCGALLVQPCPEERALSLDEFESALRRSNDEAIEQNIQGPKLTPFLLARLAELTSGRSLKANQALILNNARLAAEVATALTSI